MNENIYIVMSDTSVLLERYVLYTGSCFCEVSDDHQDLHVLAHSVPTRRSSDLRALRCECGRSAHPGSTDRRPPNWPSSPTGACCIRHCRRSEEHTSELQSLMRISYAVIC